ncbi:DNA-directed RNA polymerase subunit beta [Sporolactobacillus sp. KGMB 08714]|uniref:DNA-directed RNA polymerase subunit beta n=1 Tax=Sporolactobacillus sp. KGMB 08714 TaxID=3064704 RepID=UPI002FBE8BF5
MSANNSNDRTNRKASAAPQARRAVRTAAQEDEKAARLSEKETEAAKPLYNPFFNYHKRRFPIWQRLIGLLLFAAVALVVGAMFGYGALGHGNPWAVFLPGTWQHILDFLRTK